VAIGWSIGNAVCIFDCFKQNNFDSHVFFVILSNKEKERKMRKKWIT
jgi:hypothetical protein